MLTLTASKNTLAHQIYGRPVNQKRDLSNVRVKQLSAAFKVFCNQINTNASPDTDAIWFYMLDHLMAEIKQTYHPEQMILNENHAAVISKYNEHLNTQIARMFYYVLIICIRESRHLHNKAAHEPYIVKTWGQATYQFICSISDSPTVAMNMLKNDPPDISLAACVDSMVYIFNKGSWGGGFGGKAWGQVAECLSKFVHGEHTPLLFTDVAYTLCHNNGPIFNKGMLYDGYSGAFEVILDIQRAGMIPQMLMEKPNIVSSLIPYDLALFFDKVRPDFKFTTEYVDWFLVEALSPKHKKYGSYKTAQAQKHGASPDYEAAVKKEKEIKEAAMKDKFEFMPGHYVLKIKRPQLKKVAA